MVVDIFKLIKNRQWNELSSLLLSSEGRRLTEQGNELGELPLHFAIWVRAPDYVVASFIKAHSKAVMMEDNDKWLPLHHAAFRDASPSVVELLIRAFPESLDKHNNNGDTPRHIMNNNLKSCVKSRELVAQPIQFWYNTNHKSSSSTLALQSPASSVKTEKFSNQSSNNNNNTNNNSINNIGSSSLGGGGESFGTPATMSLSFDNCSSTGSSYASSLERRIEFLEVSFHKSLKELEKVNHINEQLLQQNKSLETRLESFETNTITAMNELKTSLLNSNNNNNKNSSNRMPSAIEEQILATQQHDKEELLRAMSDDKELFKNSITSLGTSLARLEDVVSRDVCMMRDETSVLRDSLDYHTHCFDQKLILTSKTIVETFRNEMKSNLKPIRDSLFRMLLSQSNNSADSSKMENSKCDNTSIGGGDLRSVVTGEEY